MTQKEQLISSIIAELHERFPSAIVEESYAHEEHTLVIAPEALLKIMEFLRSNTDWPFEVLLDLTAVDRSPQGFEVVYLLHSFRHLVRLRLKVRVPADEAVVPSVTGIFSSANWYEREVYDLFGIRFAGHPELRRILMPEDWVGHPLRKDYPLTEEAVQFLGHVPEKKPSELIPKRYAPQQQ